MISVTISEPLAQAAISQAKVSHRTIDSQIDHWAKIGKEENPDLSFEFINAALQGRNEVLKGKTEPYSMEVVQTRQFKQAVKRLTPSAMGETVVKVLAGLK